MRRGAWLTALPAAGLALAGCLPPPPPPTDHTVTFACTSAAQTWTVPTGVTSATFDVLGAQGGRGADAAVPALGGWGGQAKATITVTPGDTLTVEVACRGADASGTTHGTGGFGASSGGNGGDATGPDAGGGGGGGSSVSLGSTLLVAAGGGGGGAGRTGIFLRGWGGAGGGADGLAGVDGTPCPSVVPGGGDGATVAAGGAGGNAPCAATTSGTSGTATSGGAGGTGAVGGGGGGGGSFGGGGGAGAPGSHAGGGGGGGAGRCPTTCLAVRVGVHPGDGVVTITYNA